MAVTSGAEAVEALEAVRRCCYRANESVAQAAAAAADLPDGRGQLLRHTKDAGDALALLLRECEAQMRQWERVDSPPPCDTAKPE